MFKKALLIFTLIPSTFGIFSCNNQTNSNPLSITCESGSFTLQYTSGYDKESPPNLEYSFDNVEWTEINVLSEAEETIAVLEEGQTIYFRGDNPNGFNYYHSGGSDNDEFFKFVSSDDFAEGTKISISGNIMSLLSKNNFNRMTSIPCEGCFQKLFDGFGSYDDMGGTVDASGLLLPATVLNDYAYYSLFCSSYIKKAPKLLPAFYASKGCYEGMFKSAESLVTAPVIRLITLEESACSNMFYYCNSLDVTKSKTGTEFFKCPDTAELESPVAEILSILLRR